MVANESEVLMSNPLSLKILSTGAEVAQAHMTSWCFR